MAVAISTTGRVRPGGIRSGTDWLLLDTELMPWNAKAAGLLTGQYAPVGAAAEAALGAAVDTLAATAGRGVEVADLLVRTRSRAANAAAYRDAYRRYCRPTDGLTGVTLAPFLVLAGEGNSFAARPHDWHLAMADRLAGTTPSCSCPPGGSSSSSATRSL